MQKKLVFFDIDGTLMDSTKTVPPSTVEALQQLRRNGVEVAIATGRSPFMFPHIRELLDFDTYVSFNGQFNVLRGEVIDTNPLNRELIARLEEEANARKHPLVYMDHQGMAASHLDHPEIIESIDSLKVPPPMYNPLFHHSRDIYQILLYCGELDDAAYVQAYDQLRFVRWHPFSTDVMPAGCSKVRGIKLLTERLGFELADVIAFGDGLNDVEMLQAVGMGVAMGNAHEPTKRAANWTTRHVDDDGISYGLKSLGLI